MSEKISDDQRDYITILKERDKAMPMGRYFWISEELKNEPPVDICGKCNRVLGEDYVFCPKCGQRIAKDLYKL